MSDERGVEHAAPGLLTEEQVQSGLEAATDLERGLAATPTTISGGIQSIIELVNIKNLTEYLNKKVQENGSGQ
ncbi:hypothetical protein [Streptomyces halobius]|uniref:Uncharacterized protein n=1 Tax=Streptomyces halobius TaxID=2879846 RepID=A0ABY4M8B2_9ACTN|nr:hypothetical protein [Streptomyces halobius]UQA93602.1 hypothetical protein K9S39_18645 [Streptomyces halobius]